MRYLLLVALLPLVWAQEYSSVDQLKCPQFWFQFQSSCYRFIKSPLRSRNDARKNCQAYEGDLASVSSPEEHGFIIYQLLWQDPQQRRWYIGGHQQSTGYWVNDGDGTSLADLEAAFLPETLDINYQPGNIVPRDYIVYKFSNDMRRWGFEKVTGEELLLYICEVPVTKIHYTLIDDRTFEYGVEVIDREKVPRGPYFVRQPVDVVFDFANRKTSANRVTLRCEARGYPWPDYEWFRIDYELDKEIERKINPLGDSRITISGGSLIIYDPKQIEDRGSYRCKASNQFGTIVSETVSLSFGAIGDFNLKRPQESGKENWGKVLNCDPPQHFSSVRYYWAREYFPNFVEEDKRVFVSFDGALYFSALEQIDEGNYSCNVHSNVSKVGRNGPFFPLRVDSNSNFQQLKFPNNFPKAFPEAPEAGKDVRLECVAFGYPVPSYNWTRRGSRLPRTAHFSSYNRVLTIHNVQVEDQGEYVCRASNGRSALENSVILSIQAEPNFTIPLTDKHMDISGELVWTCEAFGIPDVTYRWFKNGELIEKEKLPPEDRDRYIIQDNVLKLMHLDTVRDPGMYQCEAKNILKTKFSSAQLRVLSLKPNFIKRPLREETYAAEGGNVSIVCNPEAAPKPEFTWKKDLTVIGSGGRRRILENGNLIISPVSRDDDGLYTCSAKNIYGTDESKGRLVVLKGPTIIEELPPRVVTTVGKTVYYHCKATIDEILEMAFSWKVNNLPLVSKYENGHKIEVEDGYLKIVNVTFMDAGEYECVVLSSVGRASTKSQLTVRGYPGPPGGVQILQITKKDAVVQWTDGATHGLETSGYIITGRTDWHPKWFVISENVQFREVDRYNGRKEAAVSNLVPFSTYEFRVQARNSIGTGEPSLPSPKYRTDSDRPYKAPERVGGGGGKIGDLVISWEPLPPQHQNGPGIHYKIFWRRNKGSETEFQSLLLREAGNTGVAVVRVPLDSYYDKYDVKVQAINDVGPGPESNITTIFSAEDMPQVAPQQVSARAFNSTAVNITWTPIDQTREKVRGKLIGHRLKYWKKDNREEDSVYYLSRTTRPWAVIVGLQPNTYYFVKVMAYNAAGEGPESERFLEKTYRKAPQKPPSSVNVYGVDPSTVRVVWRYVQPTLEEEPVQGYKVRVWEVDQDMSTANDTIVPIGEKLEAFVNNLSPGKSYHLRVLAFSLGGDGRMSSPAQTFQMGDAAAYRSTASKLYFRTLVVSLFVFIFHFSFNQIV